jgi:hypothetical protein
VSSFGHELFEEKHLKLFRTVRRFCSKRLNEIQQMIGLLMDRLRMSFGLIGLLSFCYYYFKGIKTVFGLYDERVTENFRLRNHLA